MPTGANWDGWTGFLIAWRQEESIGGATIYEFELVNPPGELLDAMEWSSRNRIPMAFPQGSMYVVNIDVRTEEEYFTFVGGSRSSKLPGPAYPPSRTRRVLVRAAPTL